MRIACLGGGPAGLYFAISMKLRDPGARRRRLRAQPARRHVRLGRRLLRPDGRESDGERSRLAAPTIRDEFAHWDDIDVHIHGETIRSSGHGFIGIGRKRLLNILQERARELGVAAPFRA